VPRGHWASLEHQRAKLSEVAAALGLKSLDDWYAITFERALGVPGTAGLLALHGNSLYATLKAAYPEHAWQPYRFVASPHNLHLHWSEVESFIKFAAKKLRVRAVEDWYRVSQDHLWRLGGGQLVAKNGGLLAVPPLPSSLFSYIIIKTIVVYFY
jgi:hypothetical protein